MTTNYDLARDVVRKVGGDPTNTAIVKAVAVWLRFESGSNVTGNNPWNITGVGKCGTHQFKGNHLSFATYCTPDEGTTATANLLRSNGAYTPIVNAIRAGSGLGFFTALFKSPWDGGHYVHSGPNMIAAWKSSFSQETTLTFQPGSGSSSGTSSSGAITGVLTGFITSDDIVAKAAAAIGWPVDKPLDEAHAIAFEQWMAANGYDTGSGSNLKALVGTTLADWAKGNQGPNVPDILGNITHVFGFLLDPENWLYVFAIVIGIPLALFGFYLLAGVNTGPAEAV